MRIHRQILRNAAALLAGGLLVVASVRADGPQAHGDRDEIRAQADLVLVQKIHGPERGYGKLLIESREFGDLVFEADLRGLPGVSHYGLVFRYRDQRNFYRLVLRPTNEDFRVEKVIEPKIERKELGEDFVEHYTYRAVTSLGRTHDLLDFPGS